MNPSNNINEDYKKNRPTLIPAIVNSVISVVGIVALSIVYFKTDDLKLGPYIGILLLLLVFPVVGWFNSFYSKKQKTKMLDAYDKETKIIVDFLTSCKKLFKIEESDKKFVRFETTNDLVDVLPLDYDKENSVLGYLDEEKAFISIGVGFTGLVVEPSTMHVIGVKGLLPKTIWLKKKFTLPSYTKKGVKAIPFGCDLRSETYMQIAKTKEIYYNFKIGYVCIGETRVYDIYDYIELCDGVIIGLKESQNNYSIVSLYIKVEKDLKLF